LVPSLLVASTEKDETRVRFPTKRMADIHSPKRPPIIFLALWRSGADIELAGWLGVGLAAIALIGFRLFRCTSIRSCSASMSTY
jgi:hypothetical protein